MRRHEIIDDDRDIEEFHECPKCSKRSLVHHGPDEYVCIWCGFKRDLSKKSDSKGNGSGIIPAILSILLLLGLLLAL